MFFCLKKDFSMSHANKNYCSPTIELFSLSVFRKVFLQFFYHRPAIKQVFQRVKKFHFCPGTDVSSNLSNYIFPAWKVFTGVFLYTKQSITTTFSILKFQFFQLKPQTSQPLKK